jgi:hypothetical protein
MQKVKVTICPPGFALGYVYSKTIDDIDSEFKNELNAFNETYRETLGQDKNNLQQPRKAL